MGKIDFKPGNMLYPLPAVLVTVRDQAGKDNLFTVAWAGTVCTNPPMLSISVRPERYSFEALRQTGEFVVNLTTEDMVRAVDFCGVRSGRDYDKFSETGLVREEARKVNAASIKDSPVNIECRVREEFPLGSHHMFLADVVHVTVDDRYMDDRGSFHLDQARPVVYAHGTYFSQGEELGTFGFSVRRKDGRPRKKRGVGTGTSGGRRKPGSKGRAEADRKNQGPGKSRRTGRAGSRGKEDRS